MTHEKNDIEALPESALMAFAVPLSAWEIDRPNLSREAIDEIRSYLQDKKLDVELDCLVRNLQRYFVKAVEAELVCIKLKIDAEQRANEKGQPNRPPVKLGVRLRDNLQVLIARIEQIKPEAKQGLPDDLYRSILDNQPLAQLVSLELEQLMGGDTIDPLRRSREQADDYLLEALKSLKRSVEAGVKSGRAEVGMRCLAIGVAVSFKEVTNRYPRRIYNTYTNKDQGLGIDICQILAREFHACLPRDVREEHAPRMAKTYRRVVAELLEASDEKS